MVGVGKIAKEKDGRGEGQTDQLDTPESVDVDDALLHGGAREVSALPDDHVTPDVVQKGHEGQGEDGEDETLGAEHSAPRFAVCSPVVQHHALHVRRQQVPDGQEPVTQHQMVRNLSHNTRWSGTCHTITDSQEPVTQHQMVRNLSHNTRWSGTCHTTPDGHEPVTQNQMVRNLSHNTRWPGTCHTTPDGHEPVTQNQMVRNLSHNTRWSARNLSYIIKWLGICHTSDGQEPVIHH